VFPAEAMEAWPVTTFVNSPKNQGPQCVERMAS
jgi:putative SOS response-associated peptidase YedK